MAKVPEKRELSQERKNRYPDKVEKIETRASDIEEWIGDLSEADFERDKKDPTGDSLDKRAPTIPEEVWGGGSKVDKEQIRADFEFLKEDERVLGVLVFGSRVKGRAHERSDIDICVVAPDAEPWEVLKQVFPNFNTEKKGYDVHTFEEFPLKLKHHVMKNYEILWTRDKGKLEEYFYTYRKLWKDQAKARGVAASIQS